MYISCEAIRLFKIVIFPKRPKFPASHNQLNFFHFIFVIQRYSYVGVC